MRLVFLYGLLAVIGLHLVTMSGMEGQPQGDEDECTICLEPLSYCKKRDLMVSLPCNTGNPNLDFRARYHTHCLSCLSGLVQRREAHCPICRTPFDQGILDAVLQNAADNNGQQNIPHAAQTLPSVPVSHDVITVLRAGVCNRVVGGAVAGVGYAWQFIAHDVAAHESLVPVAVEGLQGALENRNASQEERERREKARKERENRRYVSYAIMGGLGILGGGAFGVVTCLLPNSVSRAIARSLRASEVILCQERATRTNEELLVTTLWRNGIYMRRQRNAGTWSWRLYAARCFESCSNRQERPALARLSKNPYVVASTASALLCLIGSYTLGCFDGMLSLSTPSVSLEFFKVLVRSLYTLS